MVPGHIPPFEDMLDVADPPRERCQLGLHLRRPVEGNMAHVADRLRESYQLGLQLQRIRRHVLEARLCQALERRPSEVEAGGRAMMLAVGSAD